MGLLKDSFRGIDRQQVGEVICVDIALDIDEAGAPRSAVNWRIATSLADVTLVPRGGSMNNPVTRSKAEEVSLHRAGTVVMESAWL
jgi:hypothetical protein